MKDIVFIFCVASFSAGVILHLFPSAPAKRCIKAIAGLYIFASVLNGIQAGKTLVMKSQYTWKDSLFIENTWQEDDATNMLQHELLVQTKEQLEEQYTAYLQEQGYDARLSVHLYENQGTVVTQNVQVISNKALTLAQQSALHSYFTPLFATSQIEFVIQEETIQ